MDDRRRGLTGAIIAGGASSRFHGKPKGLERVGGSRIIDRVADALGPNTDSLLISSRDPAASSWIPGAVVAEDVLETRASVTGIHGALSAAGGDIVAIAWDMPFVPPALVRELRELLTGDVMAVVPRPGDRPEPLCAAYSRRMLPEIESLVRAGTLSLARILGTLAGVRWIDDAALRTFGEPDIMFFNVNTAADLDRAREIDRSL